MAGVYRHARGVLPPGTRIGRYELIRRLAKGGMAELYLARALGIHGFEKLVVLKLVLPHLAEDRQFVEMFLGEARLAATLDHPNIVHVTDIGEVGGEPFFVMEYVHGQDVRSILRAGAKRKMRVPLPVALSVVAGAATGLHYVHEKRDADGRFLGLVHRDVSPSNVMLSYEGGVKIVDFGIAKATEIAQATRAGVLKGKVNYMAPEQCDGKPLDRRTDVFALGILLYESTTGRRLFTGDNDYHIMSRIVRGVFARPSELDPHYPDGLERLVMQALSSNPDDRHADAHELLKDIESYAHDARISLSTLGVGDFLRELFGDQPLPTVDDGEDASPTALHPDARSAVKARDPAAAPTIELPGTTGVAEVRGLVPTGLIGARPGAATSGGVTRAGEMTGLTEGRASSSRLSTDVMDKTLRVPNPIDHPGAVDHTIVAATPTDGTLVAPAGVHGTIGLPPVDPPSTPVVLSRPVPVMDDDPLMVPGRSRWWIGVAAVAVAVLGIGVVVSSSDPEPAIQPVPVTGPVETIPAAAVPAAAVDPVDPVTHAVSPPEVPAPAPEVRDPPSAVPGEPVVQVEDEGDSVSDEPEPEPTSARPRKPRKRRGGKSGKSSGDQSSSASSLDHMYPGGGQ